MDEDRSDADSLVSESPAEAGVSVPSLRIEDVEGAHLLDNEARSRLEAAGFSDDEILRWVDAYFAEHHQGDVDGLIEWIRQQESEAKGDQR